MTFRNRMKLCIQFNDFIFMHTHFMGDDNLPYSHELIMALIDYVDDFIIKQATLISAKQMREIFS